MPIAGFDPSLTHIGWIIFDQEKTGAKAVLEAGTFQTSPKDGHLIQRLLMQQERIRLLLTSRKVSFVSMEAPIWKDWNSEILFALNQFIHQVLLDLKIFMVHLQPSTLKKYAYPELDPNDVTKSHMTHQAKKELNRMNKRFSEHVADAYFAGKIGLKFYQWYFLHMYSDDDLTEQERNLFCGKHTFVKGEKKGLTEYTGIIYRENERFFNYKNQTRDTQAIFKEIQDGGQNFDTGRIL
jgi:Holliday junction resolvasome RuvABC endonuclease subunit